MEAERVEMDVQKARKAEDEKRNDSRELSTVSSLDHQSDTSLTRLGLGHDVLQVQNRDQYAGHRTGEGRVVESPQCLLQRFPLPLSDHISNDRQFINTLLTEGSSDKDKPQNDIHIQTCHPLNTSIKHTGITTTKTSPKLNLVTSMLFLICIMVDSGLMYSQK